MMSSSWKLLGARTALQGAGETIPGSRKAGRAGDAEPVHPHRCRCSFRESLGQGCLEEADGTGVRHQRKATRCVRMLSPNRDPPSGRFGPLPPAWTSSGAPHRAFWRGTDDRAGTCRRNSGQPGCAGTPQLHICVPLADVVAARGSLGGMQLTVPDVDCAAPWNQAARLPRPGRDPRPHPAGQEGPTPTRLPRTYPSKCPASPFPDAQSSGVPHPSGPPDPVERGHSGSVRPGCACPTATRHRLARPAAHGRACYSRSRPDRRGGSPFSITDILLSRLNTPEWNPRAGVVTFPESRR